MDPDTNLVEQRRCVQRIDVMNDRCTSEGQLQPGDRSSFEAEANRLAELVQALDGWITGGGFLPAAWRKARKT